MTRGRSVGAAGCVCLLLLSGRASAQTPQDRPRVEVSAGVAWTGRIALDVRDAQQTRPSGERFPLFAASGEIGSAARLAPRVAVRVTSAFDLEAAGAFASPTLSIRVARDAEGAGDAVLEDSFRQFLVEGALVWHVRARLLGPRAVPFVSGGVGHFWEVHEGDTLSVTGREYFVGGGLKYALTRGRTRPGAGLGVRTDARVLIRTGGVAEDGNAHVHPLVGVSLYARF